MPKGSKCCMFTLCCRLLDWSCADLIFIRSAPDIAPQICFALSIMWVKSLNSAAINLEPFHSTDFWHGYIVDFWSGQHRSCVIQPSLPLPWPHKHSMDAQGLNALHFRYVILTQLSFFSHSAEWSHADLTFMRSACDIVSQICVAFSITYRLNSGIHQYFTLIPIHVPMSHILTLLHWA